MPAYNEEANIEKTVAQWHPVAERISKDMDCRLVIANDGSKDATYAKLQELQKQYPLLVPIDKKNSSTRKTQGMAQRCCSCIDMPSNRVRSSSSRLTATDRLTRKSSGRCMRTVTNMTFR